MSETALFPHQITKIDLQTCTNDCNSQTTEQTTNIDHDNCSTSHQNLCHFHVHPHSDYTHLKFITQSWIVCKGLFSHTLREIYSVPYAKSYKSVLLCLESQLCFWLLVYVLVSCPSNSVCISADLFVDFDSAPHFEFVCHCYNGNCHHATLQLSPCPPPDNHQHSAKNI